jgi:hypothetical protein
MSPLPSSTYGRAAVLLVLGILALTTCAAVYVFFAQRGHAPAVPGTITGDGDVERVAADARRLVTLLTILLISALFILLFVVGAYLVIRVGQFVARDRVGGKTTAYVDAWQNYRLTEEQIAAATEERKPDRDSNDRPADPDAPPSGPGPAPSGS